MMKETGHTGVARGNPEVLEVFLGVYAFLRGAEGVHREVDALEGGVEGAWRHLVMQDRFAVMRSTWFKEESARNRYSGSNDILFCFRCL